MQRNSIAIVFRKLRFKNVFRPPSNSKLGFQISLAKAFALMWTVGLTVETRCATFSTEFLRSIINGALHVR